MENASKALLIAGGVLIAILILSVLVVTINIISSNQKAKEQAIVTKQLVEFNQKWEAYNKKVLYGTDIITVMNKAIQHNNNYNVEMSRYYINITIKFKNDYRETFVRYKADGTEAHGFNRADFRSGKTYSLCKKASNGLIMDNGIKNLFTETDKTTKVYKKEEAGDTFYITSSLVELKKAFFKCTGVKYEDGRITELNFEEI